MFEVQANGVATRTSDQFRRLKQPASLEVADLQDMIHRELQDVYGDEISKSVKRKGILFGASAASETSNVDTFSIPNTAHMIAKLRSFELNGVTFTQAGSASEWAHDHNFCIALMTSSAGKTDPDWLYCLDRLDR